MAKTVWGMDIGNTAIKVAKVRRAGAGVEVADFDIEEIGFDEDDSTRPQRVREALTRLVARKQFAGDPVYISVPGNQTFFRSFMLPEVEERRISEIVQYEARQQIPFKLEEVLWGYKHHRSREGEMQISLVAVRREVVQDLLDVARQAGLNVEGVASAPVALYNYTVYEYRPEVTTVVLDAGSRVTDFVVVDGDAFWMRPIPAGSAEMVRTLRQKFRIAHQEAENLLLKMDQSKQSEKMFQVIEPVIRNLAGDIQRSLGFYKSLSRNVRVERVIGLGGAFKVPQVREYVGKMLGQDMELPAGLERFSAAPGLDVGWLSDEASSLAVALGLAVQASGLASADINLLPEEIVKEKWISRKRPWAAATVLTVLLAVLLSYFASGAVAKGYKHAIEIASDVLDEHNTIKKQYHAVGADRPDLELRLQYCSRIGRERPWFLDCLNKLHATLLAVSPRGPLLADKQPLLYYRQIYMSRYDYQLFMNPLVIEERRESGPGMSGYTPHAGMPVTYAPPAPTARPAPAEKGQLPEDVPMRVVVVGEVMGWQKPDGAYEVSREPAIPLRDALRGVPCFQDVEFLVTWQTVKRVAMSQEDYKREIDRAKTTGGEPNLRWREDLVFTLVARYDDGSDIRKEQATPAAAAGR